MMGIYISTSIFLGISRDDELVRKLLFGCVGE